MGILGSMLERLSGRSIEVAHPPLPKPRQTYVLVTDDMLHFDLLDGDEECGGVQLREGGHGDPAQWLVHVYGLDLVFPSFRKARAWLGKPDVVTAPGQM